MLKNYEFNLQEVTIYFRRRWATERSETVLIDLQKIMPNLGPNDALQVLSGYKKLVTTVKGYELFEDNATEIDGKLLDWTSNT